MAGLTLWKRNLSLCRYKGLILRRQSSCFHGIIHYLKNTHIQLHYTFNCSCCFCAVYQRFIHVESTDVVITYVIAFLPYTGHHSTNEVLCFLKIGFFYTSRSIQYKSNLCTRNCKTHKKHAHPHTNTCTRTHKHTHTHTHTYKHTHINT